jgi:membrane associated rhomboid family serine protease
LKRQFVHFHEIKSIEKYFDSVKIIAVLIGRSNKSSIFIERRNFNSGDQFEEFVQFLAQFALKNHAKEAAADIAAVTARREAKDSSFMALIALSIFGTYVVLAAPGFESISEGAIIRGGLIKESLLTDQFYRFASSFFLHYTPFHLGFNILSLAIVGQYIDVILGRVRFINVLFCSAILGSLLSLAFSPYAAVIGASGGILGLLGAYSLVCIKYERQLPGSVSVSGRVILLVLVLQILGDVATEGGDIFSHIGGFFFGFLYAGLALHRRSVVKAAIASSAERCIAAGVTLAYGGGLIYFLGLFFAFF